MIDVVVDTSVWIDVARGLDTPAARKLRRIVPNRSVGVTDVVYGEVRCGNDARPTWALLDAFRAGGRILCVESLDDIDLAVDSYRRTERIGKRVRSFADCIVAAVCIREGVPILHRDSDFEVLASCTDLEVLVP